MYTEEMDTWLAEAQLEESRNQARVQAALLQDSINQDRNRSMDSGVPDVVVINGDDRGNREDELVQVVGDENQEEELKTIHRPVLPDLREGQ